MERVNCPLEIKEADEKGKFSGYGAVFGNVDLGDDLIEPNAFKKIRKTAAGKVVVPLHHDLDRIIGEADVSQDEKGLKVEGQLFMELSEAEDTHIRMKRGVLRGMSVGFNIMDGGFSYEEDTKNKKYVRKITKAELWEVSLVTFGMNPKAKVRNVKNELPEFNNEIELKKFLHDAMGLSRRIASIIAKESWPQMHDKSASGVDHSLEADDIKAMFNKYGFTN